jgi:multimeric flavodoxin WrbA
MSYLVLNGSPRGKSSNSAIITQWFLDGFGNDSVETLFLNKINQHNDYVKKVLKASHLLMVFPLYVDGMPAQVKQFIETLAPYRESLHNKKSTFIIHSGFSEGIHNKTLEAYLNRFACRMGLNNAGVIVIPGSEGFRLMPPNMTMKKHMAVQRLGQAFKNDQSFNSDDLKLLRGHETTSKSMLLLFKVLSKTGLPNMYWNSQLKKNHAFEKRFAMPYWKNN